MLSFTHSSTSFLSHLTLPLKQKACAVNKLKLSPGLYTFYLSDDASEKSPSLCVFDLRVHDHNALLFTANRADNKRQNM